MSQRLTRTKFTPKKVSFLKSLNSSGSLTSEVIAYVAANPQRTAAQIESTTGTRGLKQLIHGSVNPTLKKHGYVMAYEVLPGERTPVYSIFKIKGE